MTTSTSPAQLLDEWLGRIANHCRQYDSPQQFAVKNPATGKELIKVPSLSADDANRAVESALAAGKDWRRQTAQQRAVVLHKWARLIEEHHEALAVLLTSEQGKPIAEARGEITYGNSFITWFAEEGKRAYGDIIPTNANSRRLIVTKEPVGLVAAITPWNFPNAMITRKVAPALAAGCSILVKPAEDTPLSALALEILAHEAGVPPALFRVLPASDPAEIGSVFTKHTAIRKLSFTGSTPVGKFLMRECADTVKKVSMELGGNAPFIVFEDADLDAAVDGAVLAKFRNAGQTCVCANRILVQRSIQDQFIEKFKEKVSKLSIGDGVKDGVSIGPLINMQAVEKIDELLTQSLERGARAVIGGARSNEASGQFFEPTILCDVTPDMPIARSEIFGPVAPVMPFEEEEEAIEKANDTPFGLAAYFWTQDLGRTWRVSEALEYGMIGVNEGSISSEATPFGGVKESGVGREGSKYGLDEFLEIKYTSMGGLGM